MRSALFRRACSALMIGLMLTGCAALQQAEQTVENNPKAVLGAAVGAAAGGLIAAAAGGKGGWIVGAALAGALIGGAVGNRLDKRDKQLAAEAASRAFEYSQTGQPSVWNNPDSGNHGSITPTRTYQLATGQYCREYRQEIYIGTEREQAYGTACRQADGSWQIQS